MLFQPEAGGTPALLYRLQQQRKRTEDRARNCTTCEESNSIDPIPLREFPRRVSEELAVVHAMRVTQSLGHGGFLEFRRLADRCLHLAIKLVHQGPRWL